MKFNGKIIRIHSLGNLHIRSSFITSTQLSTIRNIDIPSCKDCIYYRTKLFNGDFTSPLNKCSQFGEKNIFTGEIKYDYADTCRNEESKCGKQGIEFKKEPRLWLKNLKHIAFRPVIWIIIMQIGWIVCYLPKL
jgi:hypothetical protein